MKDKSTVNASNSEGIQSTTVENVHKDDVPSKDLKVSNRSLQELPETDDKKRFPSGMKSSPRRTEIKKNKSMATSLNPYMQQSTTRNNVQVNDILSKDLTDTNSSRQELSETVDQQGSPTALNPSRSTDIVPELYTNRKSIFIEHTPSGPVKIAFSENAFKPEANISKDSSKKVAGSTENSMVSSVEYYSDMTRPEETESVENITFPFDSSELIKEKSLNCTESTKPDQMALNTIKIFDDSPISTSSKPFFQIPDMNQESMPKMNEFSKFPYEAMKPPIISDVNGNKSLSEFLSILDDWARKGLDKAFDRSKNINFVDIKAHFEEDIQYGLNVIKQMITRVHTLISAANKLPDPGTISARKDQFGRNQVRGELITNGFMILHSIDDIELKIHQDLTTVKIMCINVLKLSSKYVNDMEEVVNPGNIIANLYASVISSLVILRAEIENFHEIINEFCSDLEGLL